MSTITDTNRIIQQAKTRRAEVIGSAINAYALPTVLAAGLSLMLLHFSTEAPADPVDHGAPVAQVTFVGR